MTHPADREIELLERELAGADPSERAAILREIRDIEREASAEQEWRDEGTDRGWR